MHAHDLEWFGDERECIVCGFSPDRPAWRVIVTGSRDHADRKLIWDALSDELAHAEYLGVPMVVVEGQCPKGGADKIAEQWCEAARDTRRNVYHDPFPANWTALGKIAGSYRNQAMVDAGAHVCLAFPLESSRGTFDCMRRAEEAGITVREF